jgi:DNA (cytosine-5)-methyltransferase 1
MSQIDIFEEIIVDNFSGGGGASTGIELAAGRPVAIAINHDPDAILLHKTNHPYTEHLQASVWDVDPVEVCRGRPVGLAWFSPDCKHFSKAKGAALRDRNIRGLAWIVLRWAGTVRPRVIMLENVEEFQTWGPVRKGKPVKKKAGETFRKWKQQLADLGYVIEHRELVAADYGAPTTRKRFVLVARCDGKPIVWPERTHAPRDSQEVRSGKCKPWRSAAEIIDWTLPSYSIFDSKQELKEKYGVNAVRPLAKNTLRRVIRGVDKFTIRSGKPFIVQQKFQNTPQDMDKPLTTITAVGSHEVVLPVMEPYTFSNTGGSVGSAANEPVHTIRSAGGQVLSAANLIQYHTEQSEKVRGQGMEDPVQTVDASNRYGLACANLVEYYGNGNPLDTREPLHTVTANDKEAVICAHVVKFKGQELGQYPMDTLNTITAQGLEYADCRAVLAKMEPGKDLGKWPEVRKLLNEYCGYSLREDEVLLLIIRGIALYIHDITLRMLTPRELYNAMGFPADYQIEKDYMGNSYGKSKQVARCGNAVCPPMAEAMVRANLPEYCSVTIVTMAQLNDMIAV